VPLCDGEPLKVLLYKPVPPDVGDPGDPVSRRLPCAMMFSYSAAFKSSVPMILFVLRYGAWANCRVIGELGAPPEVAAAVGDEDSLTVGGVTDGGRTVFAESVITRAAVAAVCPAQHSHRLRWVIHEEDTKSDVSRLFYLFLFFFLFAQTQTWAPPPPQQKLSTEQKRRKTSKRQSS
jgi:hypothetical protein